MSKPQFPRMPWYPRDFASSTRGWPLEARAVYRELLDAQWDQGTLPPDETSLREIARATPTQWRIAWTFVAGKFPPVEGGRRNERLEQHRGLAVSQFLGRSEFAKALNLKRWGGKRVAPRSVSESVTESVTDVSNRVSQRVSDRILGDGIPSISTSTTTRRVGGLRGGDGGTETPLASPPGPPSAAD